MQHVSRAGHVYLPASLAFTCQLPRSCSVFCVNTQAKSIAQSALARSSTLRVNNAHHLLLAYCSSSVAAISIDMLSETARACASTACFSADTRALSEARLISATPRNACRLNSHRIPAQQKSRRSLAVCGQSSMAETSTSEDAKCWTNEFTGRLLTPIGKQVYISIFRHCIGCGVLYNSRNRLSGKLRQIVVLRGGGAAGSMYSRT